LLLLLLCVLTEHIKTFFFSAGQSDHFVHYYQPRLDSISGLLKINFMNKKIQNQIEVNPLGSKEVKTAQNTMLSATAIWARVFILILLLGFWQAGESQSAFLPGGAGVPGLPAPGDAPSPVGINTMPAPGIDLHVDGQLRFQNLNMSFGAAQYLTRNPLGDIGWQNGVVPQLGSSFGQTLYWDGVSDYVPTNFLFVDPFSGGSGGVGIGLGGASVGSKLHLHEVNASSNNNYLRFSNNTGGDAIIGQGTSDNRFLIRQINFSDMVFNINTHDHMVLNPFGNLGIGDRGASLGVTDRLHLHEDDVMDPLYMRFTRGVNPTPLSARIGIEGGGTGPDPSALRIIQEVGNSYIGFYTNGSNERMRIANNGWVGINATGPLPSPFTYIVHNPISGGPWLGGGSRSPTPLFTVEDGDIETNRDYYGRNIYLSSDVRLKKDIEELSDWKKLFELKPYSYRFINQEGDDLSYGFLAQDVQKVFPELTSTWREGGSVNYIGFIPFLAQGIQEHEERLNNIEKVKRNILEAEQKIQELEKEIENLQNQNSQFVQKFEVIETENNKLKSRLAALEEFVYKQQGNGEGFGQTGTLNKPATLGQNEPNPFTQETVIHYFLPEGSTNAKIEVKNAEGKVIGTFALSHTGQGSITLSTGTLASGTYFYTLSINSNIVDTKKMVLLN
jgi:hypothetical protein